MSVPQSGVLVVKQETVFVKEFGCLIQLSLVTELDPVLALQFRSHQRLVVGSVQHWVCTLTPHLSRHLAQHTSSH